MVAFNFYPITAILIILLALFNNLPIMTIAVDNTQVDPQPVRWDMRRMLTTSTVLGPGGRRTPPARPDRETTPSASRDAPNAAGALVTSAEIYFEHDSASFGNKMMWCR